MKVIDISLRFSENKTHMILSLCGGYSLQIIIIIVKFLFSSPRPENKNNLYSAEELDLGTSSGRSSTSQS